MLFVTKLFRQGKPVVRWGLKAMGQIKILIAGLPNEESFKDLFGKDKRRTNEGSACPERVGTASSLDLTSNF
jgi:hypothetical protein